MKTTVRPVRWGCRLRTTARLHPHPNEVTCWPWVATRKALGRLFSSHLSGDRAVNGLQHTTLALTWSDSRSDRPDPMNRLVMSSPSTYMFYPDRTFKSTLQQIPNPYLLDARRRWLRVNFVERIQLWPVLRVWNWQRLGNRPSTRVYWSHIPVSTKANGLPPWFIPNTSWTPLWVAERRASEKYTAYMASSNKKTKRNLSESDSENDAAEFPKSIVIESLEETYQAKFSPFLKKKEFLQELVRKLFRKQGMTTFLSRWTAGGMEKTLKMKTFHTTKCRAYSFEKLNISKGVIRSRELALASEEERALALGKRGVTNIRTISIRKGEERIQNQHFHTDI